ncbi:MAG: hypothetical protein ACKODX_08895, partial [Gemmata sp.]
MATAVEPSSAPSAPSRPLSLPIASLLGAVYVGASLAIVFYLVPLLWGHYLTPLINARPANYLGWLLTEAAVLAALGWFGLKLAADAPRGIHGGIFITVSAAITIFFVARAFAMNLDGLPGQVVGAAVAVGLVYLCVRLLTGKTGERWMVALEEQGWFSTHQYKRSLGVKVRRLTILGFLILGGSGAWSLYNAGLVSEQLTLALPFGSQPVNLMNGPLLDLGAKVFVFALILAVTLWVGFRAVNVPEFAEFLIATEAEMNKVSWSSRKRLAQDTVVVL